MQTETESQFCTVSVIREQMLWRRAPSTQTQSTRWEKMASIEEVSFSGDGNESDVEQIMTWNPDVIIFSPESIFDTVGESAQWKNVKAITDGHYYEAPYGPYGWLSSPPAVQRYLGMLWLGAVLYPDYVEFDLQEKTTEYFELFYGCELTDAMYRDLVGSSK